MFAVYTRMLVCAGTFALVALCASQLWSGASAEPNGLKEFRELHATATGLESTGQRSQNFVQRRNELVTSFVREPKSTVCRTYLQSLESIFATYTSKAFEYVQERGGNWLSNLVKFGSMKNLGNQEPLLRPVMERYEVQAKKGLLTDADVHCDMVKVRIRALDSVMFVLQTDIKYLIFEAPQLINAAIYKQLASKKFVATNNFHEIHSLTQHQKDLLRNHYLSHVDPTKVTIVEGAEHFEDPGNYIIGRLLDSCTTLNEFQKLWESDELSRQEKCEKSNSDPENKMFAIRITLGKYEEVSKFCEEFLESL